MYLRQPGLLIFFLIPCLLSLFTHGHERNEENDKVEQLTMGNLALPGSQQPGPLLGLGQNIIDKHDFQAFCYVDFLRGRNKLFAEVSPSILYGIQNNLSVFIELPFADFKLDNQHSRGLEDLLIQFEYTPYTHEFETATNQITVIAALFLPTGNDRKQPPTGFGSTSFFLGFTANHLATDWYYYLSSFALLTTQHNHGTKAGNQCIYQAGFGKNITYSPNSWIFTWMVELSGTYIQKRKVDGIVDQNSGGNIVLLGPSLWFSTPKLILQAGIAPVISEHLFGAQLKDFVYIAFNVGWKFN